MDIIIIIDKLCELFKSLKSQILWRKHRRLCEFNNNPFHWKLSRTEHGTEERERREVMWSDGEVGHYAQTQDKKCLLKHRNSHF